MPGFIPPCFGLLTRRHILAVAAAALAVALLADPSLTRAAEKPVLPERQPVSEWVTLAGRIDRYSADDLKGENTLVIDLRLAEEGIAQERDRLSTAGVSYVHLPTERTVPDAQQVRRLAKLLNEHPQRPILLHCSSGNRAGMLWATHLIEQGMDAEAALERVQPIVSKEPMRQVIRTYRAGEEK